MFNLGKEHTIRAAPLLKETDARYIAYGAQATSLSIPKIFRASHFKACTFA